MIDTAVLERLVVKPWLRGTMEAVVAGDTQIAAKYDELGGQAVLGAPTGGSIAAGAGRWRPYANATIYWSPDTEAHEVHGAILGRYLALGGPTGPMGYPVTDEYGGDKAESRLSRFTGGAIYWSAATGAHDVQNVTFTKYLALGGEAGFMGLPVSDQTPVPGGLVNEFQGGTICWSNATGAHEVHGGIRQAWRGLGATAGVLRFPQSDEEIIRGPKGQDTGGRLSRFAGGTLYWSPTTGAFEVHGGIRDAYEQSGGPLGPLGYPITNETAAGAQRYNDFQKGVIVWPVGGRAVAYMNLRLHIGQVTSSAIDDGIDWFKADKTAELVTYLTVTVNGAPRVNNERRPGGHAGPSFDVAYTTEIGPMRHDTTIAWKVSVDDWDAASGNDYLGQREETWTIANLWGTAGGDGLGIYVDRPASGKGGDLPRLDSLLFDYSIQPVMKLDPSLHFRQQEWWSFDNFSTAKLSRAQFADTFRDVDQVEHWWDKLMSPVDWAIYEWVYSGCAAKGNCFGMSLEALFTRYGMSVLSEPLFRYRAINNKVQVDEPDVPASLRSLINLRHGYQLGDSAVRWYISQLGTACSPLAAYQMVKRLLATGDRPVLSLLDLSSFSGHAILPYRCVDGTGGSAHRILVADPNVPWGSKTGDATWVEVGQDNTFRYGGSYASGSMLGGLLPRCVMMPIPFSRLAGHPRTPFWEIMLGLATLLGGAFLVVGDAETEQLTVNGADYYAAANGERRVSTSAYPGLQRLPLVDAVGKAPELYAQVGAVAPTVVHAIRNAGEYRHFLRTAHATVEVHVSGGAQASDILSLESAGSKAPHYRVRSNRPDRTIAIDYVSKQPANLGDYRRIQVTSLPLAVDADTQVGMASDGSHVVVQAPGRARPIELVLESRSGGVVRRGGLTLQPEQASELIAVSPSDWGTPTGDITVERLSSRDGTLLKRLVMRGEPR